MTVESDAHDIHHLVNEGSDTIDGGISQKREFLRPSHVANTLLITEIVDTVSVDYREFLKLIW
jgi:hypothetical protein